MRTYLNKTILLKTNRNESEKNPKHDIANINKRDQSRTDCDEEHTVEQNDRVTVPLPYRGTFTHDVTFE